MKSTSSTETETAQNIELFRLELMELSKPGDKADLLIKQASILARLYLEKQKENHKGAPSPRASKDSTIDELLNAKEALENFEYQNQIRLNSIDRFLRQVAIGTTPGWEGGLITAYNEMHDLIS